MYVCISCLRPLVVANKSNFRHVFVFVNLFKEGRYGCCLCIHLTKIHWDHASSWNIMYVYIYIYIYILYMYMYVHMDVSGYIYMYYMYTYLHIYRLLPEDLRMYFFMAIYGDILYIRMYIYIYVYICVIYIYIYYTCTYPHTYTNVCVIMERSKEFT